MLRNPKVVNWLELGKKRFADAGIVGINIPEMSKEMGVAKSSFYFFFNSKEEYLNQLFAFWEMEGTDRLMAMVNHITDPAKRFFALGKMIEGNLENEFFYFQLKLYAGNHDHAKKFVESVDQKRKIFGTSIFKDAGQSDEDAEFHRTYMKVFFLGRIALMMGHDTDPYYPNFTKEEILKLFGFKK